MEFQVWGVGLLLVMVVLPAVVLAALLIWLVVRAIAGDPPVPPAPSRPPRTDDAPDDPRIQRAISSEHTRLAVSLIVGFISGLVVVPLAISVLGLGNDAANPYSFPDIIATLPWFGPGAAYLGLATYLLWRPARPIGPHDVRTADLAERTPWRFGPRWAFAAPLVAASLLIIVLLAAGLVSQPDAAGRWRALEIPFLETWHSEGARVTELVWSTQSIPFPGWYHALPQIAGVLLLVGLTLWALHRTAGEARIPGATTELDQAVRTVKTQFVMATSSAALSLQISLFSLASGITLAGAARVPQIAVGDVVAPDTVVPLVPLQPWYAIGVGLQVVWFVAGIVAIWLLAIAVRCVTVMGRLR